jgi:glycosylphosphatidylinositol transamidase (GPIT) subunit GPI8
MIDKICMVCCLPKLISDKKSCINTIHEYNYSCYECLDNMTKQREKALRDIYDKLKAVGIIAE